MQQTAYGKRSQSSKFATLVHQKTLKHKTTIWAAVTRGLKGKHKPWDHRERGIRRRSESH